jgi:excisionase family DNA binding protein
MPPVTESHRSEARRLQLLTVRQVAEILDLHPKTVYAWAADGRLPAPIRLGRKVMFDLDDILRWLSARKGA